MYDVGLYSEKPKPRWITGKAMKEIQVPFWGLEATTQSPHKFFSGIDHS